MKIDIDERVKNIANFMISTEATIRTTAKEFGLSKSIIHKDITQRLPKVNPQLYIKALKVIEDNKANRHIRGGETTRLKNLHAKTMVQ